MFSKIILAALVLTLSAASFGAEEASKSKEALKYLKEKFELSYHGEFYMQHDGNHDLKKFNHMHVPTLVYKPFQNWKVMGTAEFKYSNLSGVGEEGRNDGFPSRFFRALYTVTRENVLREKTHGVKMDLGVGRRVYDRKTFPATYGNSRLSVNFSRALPGGIGKNTGSLFAQYLNNDPKNITAKTWKHGVELIPTLNFTFSPKLSLGFTDDINYTSSWLASNPRSYSLTHEGYTTLTYKHNDFLSPYFQLKYVHTDSFQIPTADAPFSTTDVITYFIGCGYSATSKITLTPEIGTELFASSDTKTMSEKFKYIDLALYVDISF